ncbi:MAG TPA: hypothetical protein V6C76_14815 [Drouetiella sp.]
MIESAIGDLHDLTFTSTFEGAVARLTESTIPGNKSFDLIIAGVHFDDSSMLKLLTHVRSVRELEHHSFLPIKALAMLDVGDNLIKAAVQAMDGCPLVKLVGATKLEIRRRLEEAIERCTSRQNA